MALSTRGLCFVITGSVLTIACASSPPTDIVGDYKVSGGSRQSGCVAFPASTELFSSYWSETRLFGGYGDAVDVTTDGMLTELDFRQGAIADYLETFVGTTSFMGNVRDGRLDVTLSGAKVFEHRSCAYTVDARLEVAFGSLLYSTDLTIPTVSGAIVSIPRAISGDCWFASCPENAFVTVVGANRLP